MRFAVGTQVPVHEAAQSLRTAERALAILRRGIFSDLDHVRCDDHLPTLLLHPQTVRYRMRRLAELFGRQLHDPAWRFEMELALRADRLLSRSAEDPRGGTPL